MAQLPVFLQYPLVLRFRWLGVPPEVLQESFGQRLRPRVGLISTSRPQEVLQKLLQVSPLGDERVASGSPASTVMYSSNQASKRSCLARGTSVLDFTCISLTAGFAVFVPSGLTPF